jgi:hypothetical protein
LRDEGHPEELDVFDLRDGSFNGFSSLRRAEHHWAAFQFQYKLFQVGKIVKEAGQVRAGQRNRTRPAHIEHKTLEVLEITELHEPFAVRYAMIHVDCQLEGFEVF